MFFLTRLHIGQYGKFIVAFSFLVIDKTFKFLGFYILLLASSTNISRLKE